MFVKVRLSAGLETSQFNSSILESHQNPNQTEPKKTNTPKNTNNMKKILLTLTLTAACTGAFAQGKINVLNDSLHYVINAADNSLLSGANYVVELWGHAGTAPGSMALLTTIGLNPALPGIFGPFNWNSSLPGAQASTFQVRVRDGSGGFASGQSDVFTMQPGGSIAYNSLINPGGTTMSTWAIGGAPVAGGGFGSIAVVIPEPTSMVLAGLGAASLLLFRRRQ